MSGVSPSSWPPQHEKPTPLGQEVDRVARYWHASLARVGGDDVLSMERGRVEPKPGQHTMHFKDLHKKRTLLTPCARTFSILAFSFFHISSKGAIWTSAPLSLRKLFRVSESNCWTLGSRHVLLNSFTASTNFLSIFLVKVGPGLSDNMRMSITALYWT